MGVASRQESEPREGRNVRGWLAMSAAARAQARATSAVCAEIFNAWKNAALFHVK
jgi:hypothetical protein